MLIKCPVWSRNGQPSLLQLFLGIKLDKWEKPCLLNYTSVSIHTKANTASRYWMKFSIFQYMDTYYHTSLYIRVSISKQISPQFITIILTLLAVYLFAHEHIYYSTQQADKTQPSHTILITSERNMNSYPEK